MSDSVSLAREMARNLRRSTSKLPSGERAPFERDLSRLERALGGDPYAVPLGTPNDLQNAIAGGGSQQQQPSGAPPQAPASSGAPSSGPGTGQLGERTAQTLDAVDFPGFVSGLVTGTFRAIVDASTQQMREYAKLVADLSRSVEDFSRDYVTPNQTRDWLVGRYPQDLQLQLPEAGTQDSPKLVPRAEHAGESPDWLGEFGLDGEELTPELTEGALLDAGRRRAGEERMQSLATLVLMGINRVIVKDGEIMAKLNFHAEAREQVQAELQSANISGGLASQSYNASGTSMMVSTLKANAQADLGLKADLMGQVKITFASETFDLNKFASPIGIQLIQQHARWRSPKEPGGNSAAENTAPTENATATPAPAPPTPAPPTPAPAAPRPTTPSGAGR
jgi:hypothetical protein